MAAQTSYSVLLQRNGLSQTLTNSPVGKHMSGAQIYQINNTANQVLDPTGVITVDENDNGNWVQVFRMVAGVVDESNSPRIYEVDPLFGVFTRGALRGGAPANAPSGRPWLSNPTAAQVRVSARRHPLITIGGAHEHSISRTTELPENTSYDTNGDRTRLATLQDVGITFSKFFILQSGIASTKAFEDYIEDRTVVLFEYRSQATRESGNEYTIYTNPIPRVNIKRGWFLVDSVESTGDPAGLEIEGVSMMLTADNGVLSPWSSIITA